MQDSAVTGASTPPREASGLRNEQGVRGCLFPRSVYRGSKMPRTKPRFPVWLGTSAAVLIHPQLRARARDLLIWRVSRNPSLHTFSHHLSLTFPEQDLRVIDERPVYRWRALTPGTSTRISFAAIN